MSIAPDCDRCGNELEVPGALVFGPPGLLAARATEKLHVCFDCWPVIRAAVAHFPAGAERLARGSVPLPEDTG